MAIFKRFEIWLLILLIAGAIWFVFQSPEGSGQGDDSGESEATTTAVVDEGEGPTPKAQAASSETGPTGNEAPPAENSSDRFQITESSIVASGDGNVIEISLSGNGDWKDDLSLRPPSVRLFDSGGAEIAPFFLPLAPAPVLPANEASVAELRYWLEGPAPSGDLKLEVSGETLVVSLK